MKIFIPFTIKDIGGPSSFVMKFSQGLKERGHEVSFVETSDYDILFVIVQAPFDILMRAKLHKKVIVQRLDGVYYWSVAGPLFPLFNLKALLTYHLFTNHTVYQSNYSKYCARRFLFTHRSSPSTIIYNGVDTNVFSPGQTTLSLRDTADQAIFFSASAFRRKDQILPLLEALSFYHDHYNSNFKLVLAGTFTRKLPALLPTIQSIPWVHILGKIPNQELPLYERASDIFVFSHLNPPCPNNVIEALACGLPICGVADGAMPELITSGVEGSLIPVQGHAFWKERSYDTQLFAKNLDSIIKSQPSLAQQSRSKALEKFSLEKMLDQYEELFKKTLT